MEGPRELLRRAARNRRARESGAERSEEMSAARAEVAREAREEGAAAASGRTPVRSGHASYEALMRSHDRLRTRHLPVQGGKGGA